MTAVTLKVCQGRDITPHLGALATLRIDVFRDYPYLYDGDAEYEARYLARYADNPASLFVLAFADDTVIGAATGQPLADECEEFRAPFERQRPDPERIFYYGESVLIPEYRGQGIGKAFIHERESHARARGFEVAAFCAVERDPSHPRRPVDYQPLAPFWERHGYQRQPDLYTHFAWKDVDSEQATDKRMVFWLKDLA
ncbi:GNAT family N-acetyltransferase [Chromohalobacter sp. 48-RD10]|uniref:GNAT family N-acetyltransferase n=1 Tax=Chromohalobacter sp. 48-RD10 TaxID=2994063 RepID=UPI002468D596|nr:GNAT family N-acetyltransferase [Chromohalobacter sp. 48-RD10]